jgi:hypothetical protein
VNVVPVRFLVRVYVPGADIEKPEQLEGGTAKESPAIKATKITISAANFAPISTRKCYS